LLDHFELKRVIKMSGKFFMNTTIKPSILFFENTGKPTAAVEFWDVVADVNGSVEETMVLSVPRAAIDEACSLDMRRYQEVKAMVNVTGFPMVTLGDVCGVSFGDRITQKNNTGTIYPVYGSGAAVVPSGTHSSYDFDDPDYLLFAKSGGNAKYPISPSMGIGKFHHVQGRSSGNVAIYQYKIKADRLHEMAYPYLAYILKLSLPTFQALAKYTTGNGNIDVNDALDVMIPLPPLAIQQEIVATLDRIYAPGTTELADTIKLTSQAMDLVLAQPSGATLEPIVEAQRLMRKSAQMVADVKAQMVAIVKSVGSRGFSMVKLGDLYEIPKNIKKFNSGDMDNAGDAAFFNGKWDCPVGTHSDHSYTLDKDYFVMIKDGGGDHSSNTVGMGKFFKVNGKCAVTSHNLILVPTSDDSTQHQYVYYYMTLHAKELRDKAKYSITLGSISVGNILDFPISLPPLDFQRALVARLDALQAQLSALESLQRQSEDNARFILESYLYTDAPQAESADDEPQAASSGDDEKEEPRSTPIRRPRSVSPTRDASGHAIAAVAAVIPDYASMSVATLKDLCKARGLRGLSGKKKEELVVILRDLS
jgi:restriction endonuclease S subunit